MILKVILKGILVSLLALGAASAEPGVTEPAEVESGYAVQPGDVLFVSVWKEADMQKEVLVDPEGKISFPLAGTIVVQEKTISQIRNELVGNLSRYIPDPSVTVSVIKVVGNKVFVVGQVNRPGEFVIDRPIDVMQILSMAGGATAFADVKSIRVLRRDPVSGEQKTLDFNYKDVLRGKSLSQNVLLKSGDTVMVP